MLTSAVKGASQPLLPTQNGEVSEPKTNMTAAGHDYHTLLLRFWDNAKIDRHDSCLCSVLPVSLPFSSLVTPPLRSPPSLTFAPQPRYGIP